MSMHAPYTHQSMPMQRGYSDPRQEPPPTTSAYHSAHPSGSNQNWHQSSVRCDSYSPYNPVASQPQRENEFTSYAKRRKTTSALSAPTLHRPHLPSQYATTPYSRPSPYPYPLPSPSMGGSAPLPCNSADSDSWQWSFFPDQRSEDRGGGSRLTSKNSSSDLGGAAANARSTKQSSRHQRKRSAGCLNCHTIWSPTWRKDAQGAMRCNACGLYLAARGQERPVTLMPKGKGSDEHLAMYSQQPSTPRDDPRFYPTRTNSEEECPPSPYFPSGPHRNLQPSPSFSVQTLETSSGGSSSNSLPLNESRDMLSPGHMTNYSTSPLVSPRAFANLSLEPSRHLPYPSENTLGLKNVSRQSSADYNMQAPESGDHSVRVVNNHNNHNNNTLPSPPLPNDMAASRSPNFAPIKSMPGSPRMVLPPLSELTRGLSSKRSDFRSGRHYSVSQDRKQTELFAVKC